MFENRASSRFGDNDERLLQRLISRRDELTRAFAIPADENMAPIEGIAQGLDVHFTSPEHRELFRQYIDMTFSLSEARRKQVLGSFSDRWALSSGIIERYRSGRSIPAHALLGPMVESIAETAQKLVGE